MQNRRMLRATTIAVASSVLVLGAIAVEAVRECFVYAEDALVNICGDDDD